MPIPESSTSPTRTISCARNERPRLPAGGGPAGIPTSGAVILASSPDRRAVRAVLVLRIRAAPPRAPRSADRPDHRVGLLVGHHVPGPGHANQARRREQALPGGRVSRGDQTVRLAPDHGPAP